MLPFYVSDVFIWGPGTVKNNRKHIPNFSQKLQKSGVIFNSSRPVLEKNDAIRDIHMLTTKHEISMAVMAKIDTTTQENIQKPTAVLWYNQNIHLVDICIYNFQILYSNKQADCIGTFSTGINSANIWKTQ